MIDLQATDEFWSVVEEYLAERRRLAEEVRRENEARFPMTGGRERLLLVQRKVLRAGDMDR